MATTMTLAGDWMISAGNYRRTFGTGNVGTYTAGGIAVTAAQCGLGILTDLQIASADGYIFRWNSSTGKIMAYQSDDAVDPLD